MQLSHIRPLSVGEILDGAFTLYRRHFREFFLTALLPQIPLVVLWLAWGPLMGGVVAEDGEPTVAAVGMLLFIPLLVVASLLAYLLPLAALTRLAADAYLGNQVSRAGAMRLALRKLLPLLGLTILLGMVYAMGFLLCVVPAVLAWIVLFAAAPVVVLEGQNPVDAMSRSSQLAKGAWGEVFVVQFLLWLITIIPAGGVSVVAMMAMAAASSSEAGALSAQGVGNAVQALMTALTMPLTLTGTTLLYYDRRVRAEAFGLDADLNALETA